MTSPVVVSGENAPTNDARRATLDWRWTVEAVKAALAAAGTPPNLDIQSMLNAAFSVDGPALTGEVFAVLIGDRVRELDAEPFILPVADVSSVELSGQFLLMLLTGRLDALIPRVISLDAPVAPPDDAAQLSLLETS